MTTNIKITVEKVKVKGRGVIILTGPSSCGKGEIAKQLRKFLSIPSNRHLSMGDILRNTISMARNDSEYCHKLSHNYNISDKISIYDNKHNSEELINKANYFYKRIIEIYKDKKIISQLDWLEYCVTNGLLIPDEWTINIIKATFDNPELKDKIIILDGYPRTIKAAEELINCLQRLDIPIIKVIHLSITKEEMINRALGRKRCDDNKESLERRYKFYIEKVQPSIDFMKKRLGSSTIALIDAHQPVYSSSGKIDLDKSIKQVTLDVIKELGLPSYLLDIDNKTSL